MLAWKARVCDFSRARAAVSAADTPAHARGLNEDVRERRQTTAGDELYVILLKT